MIANALPSDMLCQNKQLTAEKLATFRRAGIDHLQVVFDFDRTLTVSRPGAGGDVTTWQILSSHLPAEAVATYRQLFERYRPKELAGTLTEADAQAWWSAILELFVRYRLDLAAVEDDFISKASIRPGTAELFAVCRRLGVPTIILSAGIREVIDLWLRVYEIAPTVVLSTNLTVTPQQIVSGWDPATVVHVLNKKEVGHPELTRIRAERPYTIVVGDSLSDADMATGDGQVLRVRIYDPRLDETVDARQQARAASWELFDVVIETGSLGAVQQLIERIAQPIDAVS